MYINKKILKVIALFICFIFVFNIISFATDDIYVWSNENKNTVETASTNIETNTEDVLKLESQSAILIEQNTGKILYEKNAHEQLRPASVTKVMTILLIMEAIDEGRITYEDKIPCTTNASKMGGSQIWLDVKESLTVDEMLKAICVVSANDCTVAMAEYLEGSQEAFVEKMNTRAKELGMNDTTFKNCHGLDEDGHLTSSYDISLMSRELLKNHPQITKYTTIWMDTLRDGKSSLVNTNKLLRNYTGATGLKTGSTSLALYNLSASATKNGLNLIAVILKAPSTKVRFEEATKVLDYGFSNYTYKEFAKANDVLKQIEVQKGVEKNLDIVFKQDTGIIIKKGTEKEIVQNIQLKENIEAPISKDEVIGEITYSLNNEIIAKTELIAQKEIKKVNIINNSVMLINNWFYVLR